MRQLIVRGIDLRAGGSYTVTYEDVTVQATAIADLGFTIEFRGNSGPGVDFGAVGPSQWMRAELHIDADAQISQCPRRGTGFRHG